MRAFLLALVIVAFAGGCAARSALPSSSPSPAPPIAWQGWSDDVFDRAKRENKLVLLDLGAVWCHWCHVMEETTYRDPEVVRLLSARYIAVRVDQDARPDLSNRYEDYGWPATVVFDADRKEIVKRRGYLPPGQMRSMLQAIIDDPTPGPSVTAAKAIRPAEQSGLPTAMKASLLDRLTSAYDSRLGAWGTGGQKYLNWDNVEYCLLHADQPEFHKMARQTLTAQLKLLDPIWGGVYQYSTDGDWDHPHFEKIMQIQAENLRIYAQAYARWRDPADLAAARKIRSYLRDFLTGADGGFYTSQDADLVPGEHSAAYFRLDDAARRAKGVPRVDTQQYVRENGWAIMALTTLYEVGGEANDLRDAERAANWAIAHRALADGGFRHDEKDAAGPYLGDTLAMGRAFLSLYTATGKVLWLDRAGQAAAYIDTHFRAAAGFVSSASGTAGLSASAQVDENIATARFANLLFHHTGEARHRAIADHAGRFISSPDVAQSRGFNVGGILIADSELAKEPVHLAIVGAADDAAAQSLSAVAIGYFDAYKRVDRIVPGAPALPNMDVKFPTLPNAAAFLCANDSCSAPLRDPDRLTAALAKLR